MLAFWNNGPYSDPRLLGDGALSISLDIYGARTGVIVNSEMTKCAVEAAFGYFIRDKMTGRGEDVPSFALFEAPATWAGADGGTRLVLRYPTGQYFEARELGPLMPLLIGIITQDAIRRLAGLCIIHSASLSLEGRGILLIGPSGSGKTTLTLALCKEGLAFLSDEFAAIDLESRFLLPFPRPILPRESTMRLLNLSTRCPYKFSDSNATRYLIDPMQEGFGISIGKTCSVEAVFLLQRTEGEPSAEPVSGASALDTVVDNLVNATSLPTGKRVRTLDVLYDVLCNATYWRLRSSSIPETIAELSAAMSARSLNGPPCAKSELETVYRRARAKLQRVISRRDAAR